MIGKQPDVNYRLLHECSNCGWRGTAEEHVFTTFGFKRCPKCMERGIELNTELLGPVPVPVPRGGDDERR